MSISLARSAAFDILLRVEREKSYAPELLHSAAYESLSPADHGLTTELVMGVLRWRSKLDDELAVASSQILSKLDLEVLIALRLALYQLRWLDRVPPHAAIYESVELVKRARKRSAAPFVNAVLRKLSKQVINLSATVKDGASADGLALALAHPKWLVERWIKEYGLSTTHTICEHNQKVSTTIIRLRASGAETQLVKEKLKEEGIAVGPGSLLAQARRIESGDVTKTRVFRGGQIVIQDEASQLVAALVVCSTGYPQRRENSESGIKILDCCAAPGGKTLAMADRNPGAAIIAVELHPHRARLLRNLINISHSSEGIHVIAADARHLPTNVFFDRVLVDAPCSGTGTLGRNPEIKWRLAPDDLAELHQRQRIILHSALARVRAGGRLIYSTCSLEREENENVVEEALAENNSFRLYDCRAELDRLKAAGELTWPDPATLMRGPYLRTIPGIHPCDGFFAAILEKT
jgi:16S rRNA (cytosine967-C5)-methyltransferase